MNVWIVVDEPPAEFGDHEILGVYDNVKAATTHEKAYRQQDEFKHQYVSVEKHRLQEVSSLMPVRKRRTREDKKELNAR